MQKKFYIDVKKYLSSPSKDWRSFKWSEVTSEKDEIYIITPKDFDIIVRSNKIDFDKLKIDI